MLTLCSTPVDVSECIRHAAGMMQPKLGVTLRNEIDPSVANKKFIVDRHRLEQVGLFPFFQVSLSRSIPFSFLRGGSNLPPSCLSRRSCLL
jgi:hypothetical protein